MNYLYVSGHFGSDNPVSLQRDIWWKFTKHFGHSERDESRQMKFGDIKIDNDSSADQEYYVWDTERSTKTRNGERPIGHKRAFDPKEYETSNELCPVKLFREFISH